MKFVFMLFLIGFGMVFSDTMIIGSCKNDVSVLREGKKMVPETGFILHGTDVVQVGEKSGTQIFYSSDTGNYVFLITANKEIECQKMIEQYKDGNKSVKLTYMLGKLFEENESELKQNNLDFLIYPRGKIFKKSEKILWRSFTQALAYQIQITQISEGLKKDIILGPDISELYFPEEMKGQSDSVAMDSDSDIFIKIRAKFKNIDDIMSSSLVSGPETIEEWAKVSEVLKNVKNSDIDYEIKALIIAEFLRSNGYYCESLAWLLQCKSQSVFVTNMKQYLCRQLHYSEPDLKIFYENVCNQLIQ